MTDGDESKADATEGECCAAASAAASAAAAAISAAASRTESLESRNLIPRVPLEHLIYGRAERKQPDPR